MLTRLLTHLGDAWATLGAGVAILVAGDRTLGLAVLAANAASHLAVQVLKRTVARARPCDATGRALALLTPPDPFSFPSGHAAAAAAVTLTVTFAHPVAGLVLVPLGAGVAATRVRLRMHHVGDVLAGALLGAGGAVAAVALIR